MCWTRFRSPLEWPTEPSGMLVHICSGLEALASLGREAPEDDLGTPGDVEQGMVKWSEIV